MQPLGQSKIKSKKEQKINVVSMDLSRLEEEKRNHDKLINETNAHMREIIESVQPY